MKSRIILMFAEDRPEPKKGAPHSMVCGRGSISAGFQIPTQVGQKRESTASMPTVSHFFLQAQEKAGNEKHQRGHWAFVTMT